MVDPHMEVCARLVKDVREHVAECPHDLPFLSEFVAELEIIERVTGRTLEQAFEVGSVVAELEAKEAIRQKVIKAVKNRLAERKGE